MLFCEVSQPTGPTLPTWASRLIFELDASDRRAQGIAGTLSPEQLNWRPQPGAWSVGQCLDHLYATNRAYLPPMSAALKGRHAATVDEIRPGWFARWFIRTYIEPRPGGTRAPAPKKIRPAQQAPSGILTTFLESNQRVRDLIAQAGGYDVNAIRFENPFIPLLRFTVGAGLEIISKHQSRHLLQAERVIQSDGFPR